MEYANSIRNKIIFVLIFIGLIGIISFVSACADDNKGMEEVLNETYKDYETNPEKYIKTKGTILEEFDADDGLKISFYGTNEWLVEIILEDGTSVETTVMRGENESIGDAIDVAYEKQENYRYVYATRLQYVECWAVDKTLNIIDIVAKVALVGMACFAVFSFIKKRTN